MFNICVWCTLCSDCCYKCESIEVLLINTSCQLKTFTKMWTGETFGWAEIIHASCACYKNEDKHTIWYDFWKQWCFLASDYFRNKSLGNCCGGGWSWNIGWFPLLILNALLSGVIILFWSWLWNLNFIVKTIWPF